MRIRKSQLKAMAAVLAIIMIFGIMPMTVFAAESVSVNGKTVQFDQPIRIEQGRILAPIRPVADEIVAEFRWNSETSTATVIFGNTGIAVAMDNPIMAVRNMTTGTTENVTLPVPARLYTGVVFVPIENVASALGLKVQHDGATGVTQITTPGFAPSKSVQPANPIYMESNIKSEMKMSSYMDIVGPYGVGRYPANGSFNKGGKTYFRGIANQSLGDGSFTYNIAGQGFTKFTGIFGPVNTYNGKKGGTITVTGDGVFFGGTDVGAEDTPVSINVTFPSSIKQIVIRLQNGTGLGDAFFSK